MFIDIHIIQTVPFSNLNRDENGTPKTVVYGDALRARVSSQSWKRAARLLLEQDGGIGRTYRTRYPDRRLSEILVKDHGIETEKAEQIASGVFKLLTGKATKDQPDGKKDVVGWYSDFELRELAKVAKEHIDDLTNLTGKTVSNDLQKTLTDVVSTKRPTTVALFGRMLADNTAVNVDAAMQVAHAFSVDEIDIEDDFFIATEDLNKPEDGMGGAHMNHAEFVCATFYRYATLDFSELVINCNNDDHAATDLARAGLLAFCLSLPSGKNNVTAPHNLPDIVSVAVRGDRPVSYAAAFESPVKASREGGYVLPAVNVPPAWQHRH